MICRTLGYMASVCQQLVGRDFSHVTLNSAFRLAELVVSRLSGVRAVVPIIMGSGMGVYGPLSTLSTCWALRAMALYGHSVRVGELTCPGVPQPCMSGNLPQEWTCR